MFVFPSNVSLNGHIQSNAINVCRTTYKHLLHYFMGLKNGLLRINQVFFGDFIEHFFNKFTRFKAC